MVRQLLSELGLNTVCDSAHCPNMGECFERRTATFLIMGSRCTRNCRFCAVEHAIPEPLRADEPVAVAEASVRMGLRHVVITSVTRDDLSDGGAGHFARTIQAVRQRLVDSVIEVLTPDFGGDVNCIDTVIQAPCDIFNHNIETVSRLSPQIRPQADYGRSLAVLAHAARRAAERKDAPRCARALHVKSGLMVGLGETHDEVLATMRDLWSAGCRVLTVGQYLAPSPGHVPVSRFVEPQEFEQYRREALEIGFAAVASAPLVRSSYQADALASGLNCS